MPSDDIKIDQSPQPQAEDASLNSLDLPARKGSKERSESGASEHLPDLSAATGPSASAVVNEKPAIEPERKEISPKPEDTFTRLNEPTALDGIAVGFENLVNKVIALIKKLDQKLRIYLRGDEKEDLQEQQILTDPKKKKKKKAAGYEEESDAELQEGVEILPPVDSDDRETEEKKEDEVS